MASAPAHESWQADKQGAESRTVRLVLSEIVMKLFEPSLPGFISLREVSGIIVPPFKPESLTQLFVPGEQVI